VRVRDLLQPCVLHVVIVALSTVALTHVVAGAANP
jgi:hypothetical protein